MPDQAPVFHLLCGKIASGKSTLADTLSRAPQTVCLSEDDWLRSLYGEQMSTGADYVRCSKRLQEVMAPHVSELLRAGVSVVLDFAANTVEQRAWMREVARETGVAHQLHVLDVPDEVCLARLHARNARGNHAFSATEVQFRQFSKHFVPPGPDEGFEIVRH